MSVAQPDMSVEVIGPAGPGGRVPLIGDSMVVGRAAGSGVHLEHAMVSRQHARLDRRADGRWQIADLKSHNGTLVNGVAIAGPVVLSPTDQVQVGPFTLRLARPTAGSSPPEPMMTVIAGGDRLAVADDGRMIRTLREVQPPRLAVDQLRCLDDFGRRVLETADPDERLAALGRLMLDPCFGGRWAVVVTVDPAGEATPLSPLQRSGVGGTDGQPRLSRSLLRAAVSRGEPVIASNSPGGDVGNIELSIAVGEAAPTMAAVAVPLDPARRAAGLLYATFPPEYGTGEWLALCALAVRHHRQAEAVWANIAAKAKLAALEADVERARKVQDRLVPKRCELPGLDLAIRFRPCLGVAGDYVDALPLPDGRSLLVIADVSGKGLPAALVAMGLHTIVHAAARRWGGLAALAADLDAHLVDSLPDGTFVTLLALTVDAATGAVEAVNAGHPAAAVFGAGTCRGLPADGDLMLGPFPQTLTVQSDHLAAGETMLLFTDGCFEVFDADGRMLGPEQLCSQSGGHVAEAPDAATAADQVTALLDRWQGVGDPSDDRTLLLVRRRAE